MRHILIVYGTTDGHTAKVAQVLAENLRAVHCCVDTVDAAGTMHRLSPEGYDGVIVAASVHIGDYQRAVVRWVRTNATTLASMPTAFLSVCLAVLEHSAKTRQELTNIMERFFARTGWRPTMARVIAGAVLYTRYGWLKRHMMKRIVGQAGGGTDTGLRVHRLERPADLCRGVRPATHNDGSNRRRRTMIRRILSSRRSPSWPCWFSRSRWGPWARSSV